jgi:periplasmic divalent cation tolerance protein
LAAFPYDENYASSAASSFFIRDARPSVEFYMTDKRIVLTTAGSQSEARTLANTLVERQLAACVSILPSMSSIYSWKGDVAEAEEFMVLIKTTEAAFDRVYATIRELHSYELPECVSLVIDQGTTQYLKWIEDSVKPDGEKARADVKS